MCNLLRFIEVQVRLPSCGPIAAVFHEKMRRKVDKLSDRRAAGRELVGSLLRFTN